MFLGVRMLWNRSRQLAPEPFGEEGDWAIYRAGLITNALNPKVALFAVGGKQ